MEKPLVLCTLKLERAPRALEPLERVAKVDHVLPDRAYLETHIGRYDAYVGGADVPLDRELIARGRNLKVVATPSTGTDHIDRKALEERGIPLLSLTREYALLDTFTATAECAWGLLIACLRRIPAAFEQAKRGNWAREAFTGRQLSGKTLGVLGVGRLGKMVAGYGKAFRMRVLGCDVKKIEIDGIEQVDFSTLLRESDVISIHVHLTDETRGLLSREAFRKMKDGVVIVNTSRGAVIDEAALIDCLNSGKVSAAGLDVIDGEWQTDIGEHPLLRYAREHDNLVISPHIGGATVESIVDARIFIIERLAEFLAPLGDSGASSRHVGDSADLHAAINESQGFRRLLDSLGLRIGPRPAGSPSIEKARGLLAEEWRNFGVSDVRSEELDLTAWRAGTSHLRTLGSASRTCESLQCVGSAQGEVEAELVSAESLDALSLYGLAQRAHGAALLCAGSRISGGRFESIQKKVSLAEAAGAAAVILVGSHPSLPFIEFIDRAHVPVLCVSAETGDTLADLCRDGDVRIGITAGGASYPARCANLVGELGSGDEEILACAHLDSFHISPGAVDNLTGIVTLTEIARALSPFASRFRRRLRLIAFTGEEYGYAGSKRYVLAHATDLDRARFVLSLDCLFPSTAEGIAVMWSPEMARRLRAALAERFPLVDVRDHFSMSSDYLPFMLAGIAAARPADWKGTFPSWTHTTADTTEKVPDSWLKANAHVFASLLLSLLTDPVPLPARRKSTAEVAQLLGAEGAEESLRWQIALQA